MSLEKFKNFGKNLIGFVKDVANDPRIPERDKKVLLGMLALIISPIDLIPDWIPFIGLMDDLVLLALVLDYFFEVLDQEIILSHFPWDMKKYVFLKRSSKFITVLTPNRIKEMLWKYKPDIYKN